MPAGEVRRAAASSAAGRLRRDAALRPARTVPASSPAVRRVRPPAPGAPPAPAPAAVVSGRFAVPAPRRRGGEYGEAVPPETRASDAAGWLPERARPEADLAAPPAFTRASWPRPVAFAPTAPPRVPAGFAAPERLPAAGLPAAWAPPRADSVDRRVAGVPLLAGVSPGVLRARVPRASADPAAVVLRVDAEDARPAVLFFADADDVRSEVFFADAADVRSEVVFADAAEARPALFFVVAVPAVLPTPAGRFAAPFPACRVAAPSPADFLAGVFFAADVRVGRALPSSAFADAFFAGARPTALVAPARPADLTARVFSRVVVAMGSSVSRRGADCAHAS
jgi:hypothetical protein